MADLDNVTAEWVSGIYQLETTDPVLGGPPNPSTGDGIDNIPHLQLAQRTQWLRQELLSRTASSALLTTIKGVDGADSGLDADRLDGQHGSYYARAADLNSYLPRSGGSMTGDIDLGSSAVVECDGGQFGSDTDLPTGSKINGKAIVFADISGSDVGCFMFAKKIIGADVGWGDTTFGNNLTPSNSDNSGPNNFTPSGTWRCRGHGALNASTLWQRIA